MTSYSHVLLVLLLFSTLLFSCSLLTQKSDIGIFEKSVDVGKCKIPGSVKYDATNQTYLVTGGGENMWFDTDAFHFVYKQASGDISLAADIAWPNLEGNPHKKAVLMIRQSLEPNARYVDAALHADGLTSIQYREEPGAMTREIQSNVRAPQRLRLEKEGNYVSMSIAAENENLHAAGGTFKIVFTDPFFIGLGVCSHDNSVSKQAVFSDIEFIPIKKDTTVLLDTVIESTLETIAIASKDRRVVYHVRNHIEAPNWSRDGKTLIFNSNGKLYTIPVTGGEPEMINTGFAEKCNNDHGLSPDGKMLAISDQSKDGRSIIYTLPAKGGTPRRITSQAPSYWHGWSPDGRTLAYCAQRNSEYDIYTISVNGGKEIRLTNAPGLDDGPDYSPDGQFIYFNSIRTGLMQIWRMRPDGSQQEQMTNDEYNNWFPHPSPDGKWIVFLSYQKDVQGHPANKDVMLRIMPADGGEIEVLAKLFGGQGTINVPSWSPDSANLAFVSSRLAY
ncbi:TolB family protein [candidate division KSB1 bacterium]|nr:TolB family protein [candidate division KSB1 bacterium]